MALIDKLTTIANAFRHKTGLADLLTLDEMVTYIKAMTLDSTPVIIKQSSNVYADSADGVVFSIKALNVASYEWQYGSNSTNFYSLVGFDTYIGASTDTVTLAGNANVAWFFRCKLTGTDGSVIYSNVVRIIPPKTGPVIIAQPANITAAAGDTVTFTVKAEKVASYLWQTSSNGCNTWNNLTWSGNATATMTRQLNMTNVTYAYRCQLTGKDGTVIYTDTIKLI